MIQRIQNVANVLLGKQPEGEPMFRFVATASVTLFVVQCLSLALGFLLNFLLVKTVSVAEYGTYIYIFNLLNLLAGFCLFGSDTLLVKMTAVYEGLHQFKTLKGLRLFSITIAFIGSGVTAIISWQLLKVTGNPVSHVPVNWALVAFPALLMLSLTAVNQAFLQGLKKIVHSQVADKIVKPVLLVLAMAVLLYAKKTVPLQELIWLNMAAIGIALFVSFIFVRSSITTIYKKVNAQLDVRSWLRSASVFFLLEIFYVVNSRIDIVLLGALKGNDAVGVYNIVLKLSELMAFSLAILNFVMAPVAAALYKKGELVQLQTLLTRSARAVLLISLPLLLVFILFQKPILLLFGVRFLDGQAAFMILCFGQLVNVLFGSVGTLLLMTGHQRFSIISLAVSLALNVTLNLVLTPRYGITGTAIATASGVAAWNFLMYLFVRVKLKIRTTAFGIA